MGGQIRTTLIAVPHRGLQRFAATVALVVVALPFSAATVLAPIGITFLVLGESAASTLTTVVVRGILSATVCLVLMVVFSAALGSITRRALPMAGAIVLYLMAASPLLLDQLLAAYVPAFVIACQRDA
ncbi:MAG: hypothetical protein QM611_01710 [Microbacterium sp.]|uniref:hypothetical protein n=1 Tax=Microbacterium sp. TaxID=51671 RepID=UPI0039E6B391